MFRKSRGYDSGEMRECKGGEWGRTFEFDYLNHERHEIHERKSFFEVLVGSRRQPLLGDEKGKAQGGGSPLRL